MSLTDLATKARQAARTAGQSLFGFARQATASRSFLKEFTKAIRSGWESGAQSIGRLERGANPKQTPEQVAMRTLLDSLSGSMTASEGKEKLNQLRRILFNAQQRSGYRAETIQQMGELMQLANEIQSHIEAAEQAEQQINSGADDERYWIRKQYPVNQDLSFRSKMQEVHEDEGIIPILTPGSTNVYSFWWIPDKKGPSGKPADNGTLYVTFKAWFKKGGPRAAKGNASQEDRQNEPGSTYAYSNVSRGRFKQFVDATSPQTAGWAVWEYLRVRGTRSGHQHPYRLTQGQAKSPKGVLESGVYIPRKATAKGFKSRTISTPQGIQKSKLRPQSFRTPDVVRSQQTWRSMSSTQKFRTVTGR